MAALADTTDLDAVGLKREPIYQHLRRLIFETRQWERGARLLEARSEPHGGELQRLHALAEALSRGNSPRRAAEVMDEILTYGLEDSKRLELCGRIYREAGEATKAARCEAEQARLEPRPAGTPLWGRP